MSVEQAEKIANDVETMLMAVTIKINTITIEPCIVVGIQYDGDRVVNYVISDQQGTHIVDAHSLKEYSEE